jgi:HAD superfamily hydrolase (TIGR01459 family)
MIPIWTGLAAHATRYDAWLCDIWGVLHNGTAVFPGVTDACTAFRRQGGRVLLVSNAPRPAAAVAVQLAKLGISDACYDGILTSGDVTRDMLATMGGPRIYHIGPERDLGLFDGLGLALGAEQDAALVVCSGLFDDTKETAETYRAPLTRMAQRNLPMVCANPDITVERGGQIIACAGALAKLYEELGGAVTYAGKPHSGVYIAARRKLAVMAGRDVAASRLLAIGDGVYTDIKGAALERIASLYIASPIYLTEPFSAASVTRLFSPLGFRPDAAMPVLAW